MAKNDSGGKAKGRTANKRRAAAGKRLATFAAKTQSHKEADEEEEVEDLPSSVEYNQQEDGADGERENVDRVNVGKH